MAQEKCRYNVLFLLRYSYVLINIISLYYTRLDDKRWSKTFLDRECERALKKKKKRKHISQDRNEYEEAYQDLVERKVRKLI